MGAVASSRDAHMLEISMTSLADSQPYSNSASQLKLRSRLPFLTPPGSWPSFLPQSPSLSISDNLKSQLTKWTTQVSPNFHFSSTITGLTRQNRETNIFCDPYPYTRLPKGAEGNTRYLLHPRRRLHSPLMSCTAIF